MDSGDRNCTFVFLLMFFRERMASPSAPIVFQTDCCDIILLYKPMTPAEFSEALVADKEAFSAYVYTPLQEAIAQLKERERDPALTAYVQSKLYQGLPDVLKDKKSLILFRHVATPNYEISRFLAVADVFSKFNTVILEYLDDKFADRNENKYFLGKMRFHKGLNKDGNPIFDHSMLINFNESNNKPISSILTKWGQRLVDFHHGMFKKRFPMFEDIHHDISPWINAHGTTAKEFYKAFLSLCLKDAILFENFLTNAKEGSFTKAVVLPAIREIEEESGYRPLVVNLEPTSIEEDHFWLSYPHTLKTHVSEKLGDN